MVYVFDTAREFPSYGVGNYPLTYLSTWNSTLSPLVRSVECMTCLNPMYSTRTVNRLFFIHILSNRWCLYRVIQENNYTWIQSILHAQSTDCSSSTYWVIGDVYTGWSKKTITLASKVFYMHSQQTDLHPHTE